MFHTQNCSENKDEDKNKIWATKHTQTYSMISHLFHCTNHPLHIIPFPVSIDSLKSYATVQQFLNSLYKYPLSEKLFLLVLNVVFWRWQLYSATKDHTKQYTPKIMQRTEIYHEQAFTLFRKITCNFAERDCKELTNWLCCSITSAMTSSSVAATDSFSTGGGYPLCLDFNHVAT